MLRKTSRENFATVEICFCAGRSLLCWAAPTEKISSRIRSGLDQSFQFDLARDDFHNVLNILAILFFLQVFRLFADNLLESSRRLFVGVFASLPFGLHKSL